MEPVRRTQSASQPKSSFVNLFSGPQSVVVPSPRRDPTSSIFLPRRPMFLTKAVCRVQGSAENFFSVGRRSGRIDIIRNFKMVLVNFKILPWTIPWTILKSVLDDF